MPRKSSTDLTEAELRLMKVLWRKRKATVSDIVQHLSGKLAYTTVLTTLRILETKRYVDHTKDGRAFVYRPRIQQKDAQSRAASNLVRKFFDKSPELLMLNLIDEGNIDENTLKRIRTRIDAASTDAR
jgi:predicted transcriptional regulator